MAAGHGADYHIIDHFKLVCISVLRNEAHKVLRAHLKTAKHLRKETKVDNPSPFFCIACNLGYHNQSNYTRHEKNLRHKKNVAEGPS